MPVFSFFLVRSVHLKLYSIHAALQERNHEKTDSVRHAPGCASQGHSCKTPQKKSKAHIDISAQTAYDVAISRRSAPERGSFHDIAAACLSCRRGRMRSITDAAERLFISQPSLSAAIHNLEKEMGVTAFVRSNKGVAVTREGEELLSFARMLLEQADIMQEHFGAGRRRDPRFCVSCQHYSFAVNAFVDVVQQYDADRYSFILRETQTRRDHRRCFLRPERARSALPVREQRERALQAAAQERACVRGAVHRRAARFHQQRPPARRQGAHHAR